MAYLGSSHFDNKEQRDSYLVEFIVGTMKTWEDETMDDRLRWEDNENLFRGRMDWGPVRSNDENLSTPFLHEFAPIIRRAAIAAHGTIFGQRKFYELIAGDLADPEFLRIHEKLIVRALNDIKFARDFGEYLISGCIYGLATYKLAVEQEVYWKDDYILEEITKVRDEQMRSLSSKIDRGEQEYIVPGSQDQALSGMSDAADAILGPSTLYKERLGQKKGVRFAQKLSLVNPFNFFWMPDVEHINDSSITIQRIFKKGFEVVPLFKDGILDNSKRKEVFQSARKPSEYINQKLQQADLTDRAQSQFPVVELLEWFGPIPTKSGDDIIVENGHIIIANRQVVVKASTNGYYQQLPPYLTAIFNKMPFKSSGAGVADGAAEQQKIRNTVFAGFLDLVNEDVHPPVLVNSDKLQDPDEVLGGVYPRQIIEVQDVTSPEDAIARLPNRSTMGAQVFQVLELLSLSGQKGAGVDTQTANPASRARITAAEVQNNVDKASDSLNFLAHELDKNCIEPILHRVHSYILQYGYDSKELERYKEEGTLSESEVMYIQNLSHKERMSEVKRPMSFEIRGFRAAMERQQILQRYNEFVFTFQQNPIAAQKVDFDYVLKKGAELHGFEADKWLLQNGPYDAAREENNLLVTNRFVAILPNDPDEIHLVTHYQAVQTSGGTDALLQHIMAHIQAAMQKGGKVPPPPPEVAEALGMDNYNKDQSSVERMQQ